MGYTSSPLLLISLTAAFSSQSYCYLIAVLGNLCERSNPLSAAHEGKGAFFHLMLAFFHLMLIRQGKAMHCFGIPVPALLLDTQQCEVTISICADSWVDTGLHRVLCLLNCMKSSWVWIVGFQYLGVFSLLGTENPAHRGNTWDGAEKKEQQGTSDAPLTTNIMFAVQVFQSHVNK